MTKSFAWRAENYLCKSLPACLWLVIVALPTRSAGENIQAALDRAKPGDVIEFAGTHHEKLQTKTEGTLANPITLRGVADATIDVGNIHTGYGLVVHHNHYVFENFTIKNAKKGLVVEQGASCGIVRNIKVNHVGNEAFKFRGNSQFWFVENCIADDTGNVNNDNGEGFYVGNAASNWSQASPDTSGYITFLNCVARNLSNDGFDIKEGAHHVKLIDCSVDFTNKAPKANAPRGNAAVYLRADHVQVINMQVDGQGNGGAAFKCFRVNPTNKGENGYGSHYEFYLSKMRGCSGASGLLEVKKGMISETKVYDNYELNGGRLYNDSTESETTFLPKSHFKEMTWVGVGGNVYHKY